MTKKFAMGIDIGGTKIMTGIIDSTGKVLGRAYKMPSNGNEPKEKILDRLFSSVDHVLKENLITYDQLFGIGLGVPGPLDIKNGIVLNPWQLPTMENFPLRQAFADHFLIPVAMDNDANSYILGESYFGAGKGYEIVLGLTLGTGLGCAIVMQRKIHLGAFETSGEICVSPYHGGIIEDFVSGAGLKRAYKSKSGKAAEPPEILALAKGGDSDALSTWAEFGEHLAYCLAWCINLLDPDVVVLGGSLTKGSEFFLSAMQQRLLKWINPVPAAKLKILPASLGDVGGMVGAACLVLPKE